MSGSLPAVAAAAFYEGLRKGVNSFSRRRAMTATHLSIDELENRVLCFGGEFGYEILSWLPYLNLVVHRTGAKIRTCSRPGSTLLYNFSVEHTEVPFTWRPSGFGTDESNAEFRTRFGARALTVRGPSRSALEEFDLGGIRWEHQRIHGRRVSENYRRLELPTPQARFVPDGVRVAVINNKSFENWGNRDPRLRESFDRDCLIAMRDILRGNGYFVVYHCFEEQVPEDRFALDDEGLFDGDGMLDMRDVYGRCASPGQIMEQQLALYAAASLAVCPQGGNSYLPILMSTPTVVLSTRGRLVEYQDLGELYGTTVDVLTSPGAVLDVLRWVPRFHPN